MKTPHSESEAKAATTPKASVKTPHSESEAKAATTPKASVKTPHSESVADTRNGDPMDLVEVLEQAKQIIRDSENYYVDSEHEKDFFDETFALDEREPTAEEWRQLNSMFVIPTPKQVSRNRAPIGVVQVKTLAMAPSLTLEQSLWEQHQRFQRMYK